MTDEVTVAEAAVALCITPTAVQAAIARKSIPARRVGRRLLLIPRAAVEEYRQRRLERLARSGR